MSTLPVPAILDRLAVAGPTGLALPSGGDEMRSIDLCRTWGFKIPDDPDCVRLAFDDDQLGPAWIVSETPCVAWDALRVEGYFETGSTNEEAMTRARCGAGHGTLIYAETQTAGRGRHGRHWVSPPRRGLYFSLVVRPTQPPNHWPLLTHVASSALASALRELEAEEIIPQPLDLELKWPNDLLLSGKKAAGILLETEGKGHALSAAVIGIGVNVGQHAFPAEIEHRATSIYDVAGVLVPRRRLLVRILYYFQLGFDLFNRGEHRSVLDQWKKFSRMWSGTAVWITEGGISRPAVTTGLTDDGALRVRLEDGSEEVILAGDVSIRQLGSRER